MSKIKPRRMIQEREFNYSEKSRLYDNIHLLDPFHIQGIIEIIKEEDPSLLSVHFFFYSAFSF